MRIHPQIFYSASIVFSNSTKKTKTKMDKVLFIIVNNEGRCEEYSLPEITEEI